MPEYKDYHISNSAGLLKSQSNHLNLVRAGISLNGVNNTKNKHNIKPVMKLKAPVIFIKNIKKGDFVVLSHLSENILRNVNRNRRNFRTYISNYITDYNFTNFKLKIFIK